LGGVAGEFISLRLKSYLRSHYSVPRKPLGEEDEPFEWVNETKIAPWVIYVLRKAEYINTLNLLQRQEDNLSNPV